MISLFTGTSMLIGHRRHMTDEPYPVADQPVQRRERLGTKMRVERVAQESRAEQADRLRRLLGR